MTSIVHHSDFVSAMASIYKPRVYLELGLYMGETLNKTAPWCEKVYGVDTNLDRVYVNPDIGERTELHQSTTDDFFEKFKNLNVQIDMAFIDADHHATSALRDLENVLRHLRPGGVVIMHDTDPLSDHYKDPGLCGDSYKLVEKLEHRHNLNIVTVPLAEAGLSLITRKKESRTYLRDSLKNLKND